ncbi:hypothetical protein PMAYCL1PPCAC_20119 [Pristionchus mayeri]|uniref:Protein kinase domain-containing protein n=1 Tax=Pristionchus mayeri TaxID=1317129 RepID=A0AAN5CSS8_9BILA|nr:hypothetical protein PMAYCL1PPCAC_20119 [Pristionchus mayeri]
MADFGISKKLQTAVSKTRATTNVSGTDIYMAPERFQSSKFGIARGYGSKSEVWSLGITVYECATGLNAYTGVFASEDICDDAKPPPSITDKAFSPRLRNFVKACLFKDEKGRASVNAKDDNNLQDKLFYKFHAARDAVSVDPTPVDHYFAGKLQKDKQVPRRACVIDILERVKEGLPQLRDGLAN